MDQERRSRIGEVIASGIANAIWTAIIYWGADGAFRWAEWAMAVVWVIWLIWAVSEVSVLVEKKLKGRGDKE